jgi:hypothetical protein
MPSPRPTRASLLTSRAQAAAPAADAPTALPTEIATLRAAFLVAVARDTPGSDLERYTVVLDDLLAWAAANPDRVVAMPAAGTPGVIAFAPASGATGPRWSVRPVRGETPVVELLPAAGDDQEAASTRVRALFNAHSRAVLGPDSRPRIGFGALKNPEARAALLALLDELLVRNDAPRADA